MIISSYTDICLLFTVEQLKKRWKNLKDSYRRELKKITVSRSGEADTDTTVKWKYFELLGFLKDEILHNCCDTNLLLQEDNCDRESLTDLEDSKFHSSPFETTTTAFEEIECILGSPDNSPSSSPLPPSLPEYPSSTQLIERKMHEPLISAEAAVQFRKRKISIDTAESLETERKRVRMLEIELLRNKTQTDYKSDDYHFLMSILPQLEKLPALQKMRVRNKINQAIIEEMEKTNGEF